MKKIYLLSLFISGVLHATEVPDTVDTMLDIDVGATQPLNGGHELAPSDDAPVIMNKLSEPSTSAISHYPVVVATQPLTAGNKLVPLEDTPVTMSQLSAPSISAISLYPGDNLAEVLTKAATANGIQVLWRTDPINVNFAARYPDNDFIVNINDIFRDMEKSKGMRFEVTLYKNNVLVVSSEQI